MGIAAMLTMRAVHMSAQSVDPEFIPPATPVVSGVSPLVSEADTVMMPFPVRQTVPVRYEDIMEREFAADLSNPSNVTTVTESI